MTASQKACGGVTTAQLRLPWSRGLLFSAAPKRFCYSQSSACNMITAHWIQRCANHMVAKRLTLDIIDEICFHVHCAKFVICHLQDISRVIPCPSKENLQRCCAAYLACELRFREMYPEQFVKDELKTIKRGFFVGLNYSSSVYVY